MLGLGLVVGVAGIFLMMLVFPVIQDWPIFSLRFGKDKKVRGVRDE